jgi:hypothetical protein
MAAGVRIGERSSSGSRAPRDAMDAGLIRIAWIADAVGIGGVGRTVEEP